MTRASGAGMPESEPVVRDGVSAERVPPYDEGERGQGCPKASP